MRIYEWNVNGFDLAYLHAATTRKYAHITNAIEFIVCGLGLLHKN